MNNNFLFIDDSGSKDWETPYSKDFIVKPPIRSQENINFWRRNYFVLAGLHVNSYGIKLINPIINKAKIKYFGTKHVEIKSDWLRNPARRKKRYLDKFKITEAKLTKFIEKEWYKILETNPNDIQIQAFVIDKRYYHDKRSLFTPLHLLTQVLFDRVELHSHKKCVIVFDQMDNEIKSTTHIQGQILKVSSKQIDLGSFHNKFSHSIPRFEKSINSNFLQLADTVAYNVYRQFVNEGDIFEDEDKWFSSYPFIERIKPNFYSIGGKIKGFGIVKVPKATKNPLK